MAGSRFWPVTINGFTYTERDFAGTAYVTGLPAVLHDMVIHAASSWSSFSTSAVTIGPGAKSFTAEPGKPWLPGAPLRVTPSANLDAWVEGKVTGYNPDTGALQMDVYGYAGAGAFNSWNINAGGGGYAISGMIPLNQGGTGAPDAAGARTALGVPPLARIITAGFGIGGGGSLAADFSLFFDPTEIPQEATDPNADLIIYQDSITGAARKSTLAGILAQGSTDIGKLPTGSIDLADSLAFFDTSLNASARVLLTELARLICPVGTCAAFGGPNPPTNWLFLEGQTLSRSQYPELFDVIGTFHGAPDGNTFKLPDARGRAIVHLDAGAGRLGAPWNALGGAGGTQFHLLTAAQSGMPAHAHSFSLPLGGFGQSVSSSKVAFGDQANGGNYVGATTPAGPANATEQHPNMQPTIALNWMIKAR